MSWKSNEKTRGVFSDGQKHHRAAPKPRGARTTGREKRKSGINSVAFTMLFHNVVVATLLYLLRRLLRKLKALQEGPQRVGGGGQGEQSKENKKQTNWTYTKHNPKKKNEPPEAQATTRKSAITTNSKTQHKTPNQGQQPQTQKPPETTLLVF